MRGEKCQFIFQLSGCSSGYVAATCTSWLYCVMLCLCVCVCDVLRYSVSRLTRHLTQRASSVECASCLFLATCIEQRLPASASPCAATPIRAMYKKRIYSPQRTTRKRVARAKAEATLRLSIWLLRVDSDDCLCAFRARLAHAQVNGAQAARSRAR